MSFLESEVFIYIVIPALIFFARIIDVSIGTMRIIFVSRGAKIIAPLLGFFEVLIWLLAIGKVMQNLDNWLCYVSYAAGFAAGTYIGICIEEKLAMGTFIIRVVTKSDATDLINRLREEGYGATSLNAQGSKGQVNVIYSVVRRESIAQVVDIIRTFNPKAFYSIEDIRYVSEGIFPQEQTFFQKSMRVLPRMRRKGK